MRVFVTGATGWVGSAVVKELIAAGHQVLGLTRSDKGAEALAAEGAEVHRGSLADVDSLRSGTARCDGVIHTAFNHDFSKFAENCVEDRSAIDAIGAVLAGSDRPLIVTSGVARVAQGRVATEQDPPIPVSASYPRASEATTMALAARGVRATVRPASAVGAWSWRSWLRAAPHHHCAREGRLRLHRRGPQPLAGRAPARRRSRLPVRVGARREGGPFHAVAEDGVPFKAIAEVIGRRLNVPVVSKSPDEAAAHFGWFAMFAGFDLPTSSARTRALLGWQPDQPGLLADIDHPAYFAQ